MKSHHKVRPEDMRVGWHTTLVGRKLDQGILVKMVLEDTAVLAVHKVNMNSSATSHLSNVDPDAATCATSPECASACCDANDAFPKKATQMASAAYADVKPADVSSFEKLAMNFDPHELAASMLCFKSKSEPTRQPSQPRADVKIKPAAEEIRCALPRLYSSQGIGNTIELPEVGNQEVLGEWLIPTGECLLVSFGPHTVADTDGKAVVRERLAFVEAEEFVNVAVGSETRFHLSPAPPSAIVPYATPAPHAQDSAPAPVPAPPVAVDRSAPPSPSSLPARSSELPSPPAPSRSFPQGIHSDGSKAKLPPLPDDEMEDGSSESESAEPLPSPQTKKPRRPRLEPANDAGTTKASYAPPRSSTVFLPSVFLPGASVGFQFLLPIQPLSIRLPFNQRLEIEIFGRVVPDTRVKAQ